MRNGSFGTHRAALGQDHVARQVPRLAVLLAERRHLLQLRHVFKRKLAQVDAGIDVDARMEAIIGQRIHVRAQTVGEFGQRLGRQRHTHRSFMAAKTREQIGAAFHCFEQVDLPHAASRSARLAVFVDGEQQHGHP